MLVAARRRLPEMSRMLQLWSTAVHNTSELAPMPSCTGTFPLVRDGRQAAQIA